MPGGAVRRSDPIVLVARAAIGRAKRRRDDEVTPDDLLVGALEQVGRFGIAVVGPWTFDLDDLEGSDAPPDAALDDGRPRPDRGHDVTEGAGASETTAAAPRYDDASVSVFEAAARVAREDGAATLGLVHLLVALGEREDGLMARLRDRHGFTATEWRAALARGLRGSPGADIEGGAGVEGRPGPGGGPAEGGRGAGTPELLSVDEAASFLGVHAQTVRNYIRGGKLPAYRLAGERFIRVLRRDLLALLEPVGAEDAQEEGAPEVELPVDLTLEEA